MEKQKNEVLALICDTTKKRNLLYNELFALYRQTPGKNITQENHLNRVGFNNTRCLQLFMN